MASRIGVLISSSLAGSWLQLLVRDYLDGDARHALFATSRACHDVVLTCVQTASLSMWLSDIPQRQSTLHSISTALQTRGNHANTLLRLYLPDLLQSTDASCLHALPGSQVQSLVIDSATVPKQQHKLPSSLLFAAGTFLPRLQSLTIRLPVDSLPPAHVFPALSSLRIYEDSVLADNTLEQLCASLSHYLPRLSHLTLHTWEVPPSILKTHMFQPPNCLAGSLQTLDISATLDTQLLQLLLRHAPALEMLAVSFISLHRDHDEGPDAGRGVAAAVGWGSQITSTASTAWSASALDQRCSWKQLKASEGMTLGSFLRLPLPADMQLTVKGSLSCDVESSEDSADLLNIFTLMKHRRIKASFDVMAEVWTRLEMVVDVTSQPTGLCTQLNLLRALSMAADGMHESGVRLSRWCMTSAVMRELRNLPHWKRLDLFEMFWLPDPVLYCPLLRLLPSSFSHVSIQNLSDVDMLTDLQYQSICMGAPLDRSAVRPLRVVLPCAPAMLASMQRRMQELGYAHVTVSVW